MDRYMQLGHTGHYRNLAKEGQDKQLNVPGYMCYEVRERERER